jgi:hypothetical protein
MGHWSGPVAIGGVGGSGTRVVAAALSSAGWYLGGDLNDAVDNLWFTTLFKHVDAVSMPDDDFDGLVDLFVRRMRDGHVDDERDPARLASLAERPSEQHTPAWFAERVRSMTLQDAGADGRPWGWKEPNTHMVIDRLARCLPELRYVHVARNGLDMAVGSNQNQPRLWGDVLGVHYDGTPAASLRFWCAAQRRVLASSTRMADRFLFLRFEDLCADPRAELERLVDFCGIGDSGRIAEELAPMVRTPTTLGRGIGRSDLDPEDLEYVRSLGFAVD